MREELAFNATHFDDLPEADRLWIVIVGAAFTLLLGFGWGANGLANIFATSVGAGVINDRQAKYCAIGFQIVAFLYIALTSAHISFDNPLSVIYNESANDVIIGQVSFIISSAVWVCCTSVFGVPVSSRHCITGSAIGFILIVGGFGSLKWERIQVLALSLLLTPLITGVLAFLALYLLDIILLRKQFKHNLLTYTVATLHMISSTLFTFGLLYGISCDFGIVPLPLQYSGLCSVIVGLIVFLIIVFFIDPMLHVQVEYDEQKAKDNEVNRDDHSFRVNRFKVKKINMLPKKFMISIDGKTPITNHISPEGMDVIKEKVGPKIQKHIRSDVNNINSVTKYAFSTVLFFTCGFMAFIQAVENIRLSALPLNILIKVYQHEVITETTSIPPLLALYVTPVICCGIYFMGGRVMNTVAFDLGCNNVITHLMAQLATTIVINMSPTLNVYHSNSYCLVFAMICLGFVPQNGKMNWKALRNIVIVFKP
ncbi:unnamed protein product [Bursaphelenchus okinawaensis]|uniref:Phosphate transporter n=1 Tax=Bursaphelenchus okinawaensis TaxID=465554 RepID=A0A811L309_9BILA|nr:unnamed protein product [Bursaphelenchus okinawaensis]CAG9118004.1 unnamed protein product [Bursaphelenchus okinawaensis]